VELLDIFNLFFGLALFLYGMHVMGDGLKKSAGKRLKSMLQSMTSNTFKGFLLGAGVTAIMQSSSATTVMVVGFVNSGLMTLKQAFGVILGANLGTTITGWILALGSTGGSGASFMDYFSADTFIPVLAVIGVVMVMFMKNVKRNDLGTILMGFAVLMAGMDMMSGSVAGLKESEAFGNLFVMFENPVLGVLVGVVVTVIIQSSSASVGILQALTITGKISYMAAVPIIMGQNIGTCITAILSSIGASKDAKRAAVIHLSYNVISTILFLPIFLLVAHFGDIPVVREMATPLGIAIINTSYKVISLILMPFGDQFVKLANFIIKSDKEDDKTQLLDERLIATPSVAIERCKTVTVAMAELAVSSIKDAISLLGSYDEKAAQKIHEDETLVDEYEDKLGSYLVKLSNQNMPASDSLEASKLLHVLGDFERISDHAMNIAGSAEEIHEKKLEFSNEAKQELKIISGAVCEILDISLESFKNNDLKMAFMVEPLEQVVDYLRDRLKKRHVNRLRKNECTIELGFVLTDLLTNLERVSDHCSNIAVCVLEIAHNDDLDIHEYMRGLKKEEDSKFNEYYDRFKEKYALPSSQK